MKPVEEHYETSPRISVQEVLFWKNMYDSIVP